MAPFEGKDQRVIYGCATPQVAVSIGFKGREPNKSGGPKHPNHSKRHDKEMDYSRELHVLPAMEGMGWNGESQPQKLPMVLTSRGWGWGEAKAGSIIATALLEGVHDMLVSACLQQL